ncbi:MAG: 1-acyl-sn-glycerol-3-phosphate acyltransferase [Okeania sp. SIO2C2]|uniref:lysophospholipid acyltransferase family protein n=1 Tax=Okeania sp. SIO2C2 TaxID=2607787 RepID=UPI0013B9D6C1|nr:1-acyl-sn-glycerol-3-phosphate acyltransferase [Okeania sp. SIO2C2]NEP88684.1 1-acyl-sn-glycerol-3-phosphate acyltransferase [Okeania sp. SIO2C2]
MTKNNKPKNDQASAEVTSEFSAWLTPLTYFLSCCILVPFYFKIEIRGQKNIPKTDAIILAPTHRSRWDPLIIAYAAGLFVTNRKLRYMVSEEQTRGFQGWFIRRLGGFPVDRDHPGISSIRHSVQLLKNQEMLVLFPEGRIYPENNKIYPIQSGVSRIALQAISSKKELNLKIIPVSILYDHPAPPPWRCGVKINIGSPLEVKDYLSYSTKQAAKILTDNIELSMTQLHKKH